MNKGRNEASKRYHKFRDAIGQGNEVKTHAMLLEDFPGNGEADTLALCLVVYNGMNLSEMIKAIKPSSY